MQYIHTNNDLNILIYTIISWNKQKYAVKEKKLYL